MSKIYSPSIFRISKYVIYLRYFIEYIKMGDFTSLTQCFRYVITGKGASKSYLSKGPLGKFLIRKGTSDMMFVNYQYERKVKNYIVGLIENKQLDVFFDIGACIGEYCVWLAKQGVKTIAFEPVNYEAVRKNVQLNYVESLVSVKTYALGSEQNLVNFKIPEVATGSSHFVEQQTPSQGKYEKVIVTTLDSVLDQLEEHLHVVIKLDVEGMETKVLEGARKFIKKTNKLKIIYERYPNDDTVDKKLVELGDFVIEKIDEVNYLATKRVT